MLENSFCIVKRTHILTILYQIVCCFDDNWFCREHTFWQLSSLSPNPKSQVLSPKGSPNPKSQVIVCSFDDTGTWNTLVHISSIHFLKLKDNQSKSKVVLSIHGMLLLTDERWWYMVRWWAWWWWWVMKVVVSWSQIIGFKLMDGVLHKFLVAI